MKKRKVYLLGAGAALDWFNAPSTTKITDSVISSGFKNKEGEYVTKVIYDWLLRGGKNRTDINFETIINVIEDFVQYWSNPSEEQINGLAYFVNENDPKWSNFIHYEINRSKYQYALSIPEMGDAFNSRGEFTSNSIHPNAKYFELLLMHALDGIVSTISNYSFCIKNDQHVVDCKENKLINELAINFFKNENQKNILRIYSMNYDRLIEFIFFKAGIDIYQGFSIAEHFPDLEEIAIAEPKKILTERNINCIYHLHGNAWWNLETQNNNGIDAYSFTLDYGNPGLGFNNGFGSINIEKSKKLLVSNIITGYQKAQRTSLSPFRQMLSSFDQDCYEADEIVVCGYSFGDEHINDILRNAKKYNPKTRVTVIDPSFSENDFGINFISHWGAYEGFIFEKIDESHLQSKQYNVDVYKMTLKEYLKKNAK